ncbi:MAG: ATP-binding protein [Gammaproteobacteria bacterium]|nr:ATP-binding protein [Gammaproteobacteria bacterium]
MPGSGQWIRDGQTVLVTGATGRGSPLLASAFGHHACRLGISTRDFRVSRLLDQLAVEHLHDNVGDPTLGDAILDRVLNNAHRITVRRGSMRRLYASTRELNTLTTTPDPSMSSPLQGSPLNPDGLARNQWTALARNRWMASLGMSGQLRRNRQRRDGRTSIHAP